MKIKAAILLMLAFGVASSYGASIFVSQAGAGSQNGTDAADAFAWTWLTNSTHWNNGVGTINAGDTVHLVGTLSSNFTVQASGTVASPITILFETGAKLSAPTLPNVAWIQLGLNTNIVIDGGVNGVIQCTDNGTPVANGGTHTYSNAGINAISSSQGMLGPLTIKNLSILNMYDRQTNLDSVIDPGNGIELSGCSSVLLSNCFISGAANIFGDSYAGGSTISNITIVNCVFSNYNHGVDISTGNSGPTLPILLDVNIKHNIFRTGDTYETPDWFFTNSFGVFIGLNTSNLNDLGAWNSGTSYTPSSTPGISNVVEVTVGPTTTLYIVNQSSLNVAPATDTNKWRVLPAGDFGLHRDSVFMFNSSSPGYVSNLTIAYNFFKHCEKPLAHTAGTACMYLSFQYNTNVYNCKVYNNVCTVAPPAALSGGGGLFAATGVNALLANNTGIGWTLDGTNWGGGVGFAISGTNAQCFNNIMLGPQAETWASRVTNDTYSDALAAAAFSSNGIIADFNLYNFSSHANSGGSVFGWTLFGSGFSLLQENYDNDTLAQWTNYWVLVNSTGGHSYLELHSTTNLFVYNTNSFAPLTNDTSAIGKGTNLSQYFTDDYAGNPRPPAGPWTIGAFQIGTTNVPPPGPSNSVVTVSGTIQFSGGVTIN